MPPTAAAAASPSTSTAAPDSNLSTATTTPPAEARTRPQPLSSPSPRTRSRRDRFASPGADFSHREGAPGGTPAGQPVPASQHKPSPAVHRSSYTTFPSTSTTLPRPPSLLPAARPIVDAATRDPTAVHEDPFNDHSPTILVKELEPSRWKGHSRSSSSGGLSDGFRNLNRWSASTTSSRASNFTNFTRRVSAEVFGSPTRKLHKREQSNASDSQPEPPVQARSEPPALAPIPPLQSLPRISTGPSLEDEVREANVLEELSSTTRPIYAKRPSEDPWLYWDGAPRILEEEPSPSFLESLDRLEPAYIAAQAAPDMTMPYTQNREARGHSRTRSSGANGVAESGARSRDREKPGRPPSQKAMLSKALQKANTAVQLDNAQNIEGARRAYSEACALLQQVLQRTSAEEDRNKLEAIHTTYTARIIELDEIGVGFELDDKELPHRPESNDSNELLTAQIGSSPVETGPMGSPNARDRGRDPDTESAIPSYSMPTSVARRPLNSRAPPGLTVETSREPQASTGSYLNSQYSLHSAFSRARQDSSSNLSLRLHPPMDDPYVPPPLSPRRPISPTHAPPPPPPERDSPSGIVRSDFSMSGALLAPQAPQRGHQRVNSHESVSWLDPIDESAGSSASSVHSRTSSMNIKRRHIRGPSGDTEAEFDAALDDAIEAAYDDGYEPDSQFGEDMYQDERQDPAVNTLRKVEMAREKVRESEREALELANERERKLRLQQQMEDEEYRQQEAMGGRFDDDHDGHDTDDEERILEEMTRGYSIEDFAFGQQPRLAVPRESDSSWGTSRTWHSSMGSNPPTSTTVLTTVSEHLPLPQPTGPLHSPPKQALPQLPPQPTSAGSQSSTQSVRNRRMSGQNPKQLKIETSKLTQPAAPATAGPAIPVPPKSGSYIVQQRQALSAGPTRTTAPLSAKPAPSPVPSTVRDDTSTPPLPPSAFAQDEQPRSGSPSAVGRPSLRKNFSSSSLKSFKSRNLSVSNINIDDASDLSPGTPLSNQYGIGGSSTRLPTLPSIPTPLAAAFTKERSNSVATGGFHLFENHIHSPTTPGSPNPVMPDGPVPLEPCPNDTLLRPFWLMRCLYQTLCHPRGGYLSNKLFVPRDVWRVKGVKLKNLEDKTANCDYLTAALQKLAKVDNCDADAVLEEMQSLESVLEHVQAVLTRKLGTEVGVQGASAMFKDAGAVEGEASSMPRSASVTGKGSSFSWRRLRNKGSSANLPSMATSYGGKGGSGGASAAVTPVDGAGGKDTLLPSLPMTSHPTSRPTKRDVGSIHFSGPNAAYMASLAKLFDAAQVIDQIARQVEDPGLRHADKTQVGLELCTRHAAEFFGFYICRFVLSDLTLMLDKFIKRGSEWVVN